MFFHKAALLHHCCASEKGRYALNAAHLSDYGLVSTDGRKLSCVPPLQLEDHESDFSAAFRLLPLQDPQLKAWLRQVPAKIPVIRVTCKDPTAADGEGILRFECMVPEHGRYARRGFATPPQPLELQEAQGPWPDYMAVMPKDPASDYVHINVDADYLSRLAELMGTIAMGHKPDGVDGMGPIITLRIHKKESGTALVIDGPLGIWSILMPVDGGEENAGATHPKHLDELSETQTLDISALSSPLPLDYFSRDHEDDEALEEEPLESDEDEESEADQDEDPVEDEVDEQVDEDAEDELVDDDGPVIEEVEVTGDKVPVLINDQPN